MTSAETLRALVAQGRHAQALAGTEGSTDPAVMILRADLLKAEGRLDEALAVRRAVVAARPTSAVAEHNLAALLGDMHQAEAAEAAVRRAFAKGGDAPETWLVLARALLAQGRHADAETAFGETVRRRPTYTDAVRELTQLIWMRTADPVAALQPVEAALTAAPTSAALQVVKAVARQYFGEREQDIWRDLTTHGPLGDPALELKAADLALSFDRDQALAHAERAVAAMPTDIGARLELARVHLARGNASDARALIEPALSARPDHQHARALLATAARLDSGPGATAYDHLVRGYTIDTPPGWPDLGAYLADMTAALQRLHGLRTHPIGQSLRHGTQTSTDLTAVPDPVIQAFFSAIDAPIRAHLRHLGQDDAYRLSGCWSVRLSPGGHHAPHFHSQGRLSSACYIDLPPAIEGEGRQGWIGFGQPPFDCGRPLPHEHFERPAPGRLVLFPSWLWHGTVPFEGQGQRLTIAFDVIPA